MKLYCEKCNKDITITINESFDKNLIGNLECPHCKTKQKRYISEADLLIYLSFVEISYFILTLITFILFYFFALSLITIISIIVLFVLIIVITNKVKYGIYAKGIFKKIPLDYKLNEDQTRISRTNRWQFLLFFALVITFMTQSEVFWFFLAASFLATVFTCIKTILALNNEKSQLK